MLPMHRRALPALLLGAALAFAACSDDGDDGPTDTTTTATDTSADATPDGGDGVDAPDGTGDDDQAKILAIGETDRYALPCLTNEVQVVRVEGDIPHIYATTREDLGCALGFVAARDRYLIMDLQRRLGLGTLSELLGDLALGNDLESRFTGFGAVSAQVLAGMTGEQAAYIDAFAEGINAYIARVKAQELPAPSELDLFAPLLGFTSAGELMQDFDRADIAAMVAVVMYETNFETGDPNRQRDADWAATLDEQFDSAPDAELRRAGARQIFDDLTPNFPVASTAGFGVERGGSVSRALSTRPANGGASGARGKRVERGALDRVIQHLDSLERRLIRDKDEGFGSNTWAVAGSKTTDGAALVAGDGHLQLSMPALFYHVGLNTQVFGGGDIHQAGLLLTSLPIMAVGTNGSIGWSQVNPVTDTTDWYREELTLDAAGAPASTLFDGGQQALVARTETFEIADVSLLGSVGRTETVTRYETFDGRWITSIEGEVVDAEAVAGEGETIVNVMGSLVIPKDMDDDGVITALSFDWTGFDATGYTYALDGFGQATSVEEMRTLHQGQVGGGLYTAAADRHGDILFSSYQGLPCRGYLEKDEDGWTPGSHPQRLLDGTVYGGFRIPVDANGLADPTQNGADPYVCVVPLSETPQAVTPDAGFVVNANNQPAPITLDGRIDDDEHYIGGPWSSIRADSITAGIVAAIDAGSADVDAMMAIQADNRSRTADLLLDPFLAAIARAQALSSAGSTSTDEEARVAAIYDARAAAMDEVATRLAAWKARGLATDSGVETFYHAPTADDREDAVATMIWNAWLPRALQQTFDDEGIVRAFRTGSRGQLRELRRMLLGRGADNPQDLACWSEARQECVFFDKTGTPDEVESGDEVLLQALAAALDFLEGPTTSPGQGGFGTTDMSAWLWGLRHQTRFVSLLADALGDNEAFAALLDDYSLTTTLMPLTDTPLPNGDPRKGLKWYPRGGDNYGVDAANPGFSGTGFTHGSGPVMRMVIALKDGQVTGRNIIPGGQSALIDSPYHHDQARLWLANETFPFRFHVDQVVEGATGREVLEPAAE